MPVSVGFIKKLDSVPPELRQVLIDLLEEVERQREESVTKREFNELKEIVRELAQRVNELAEAQRRTEQRVEELAEAQRGTERRLEQLAEAQAKTEERVSRLEVALNELAEAQRRTEQRVEELAEAQRRTEEEIRKLAQGQRRLRQEVGGLARSVAYALENEAFRRLPEFLKTKGIEVLERMVRTEVAGEEINLFGRARRNGEELLLVGEAVLRLDDPSKLRRLKEKAALVETELGEKVLPVLITHFAVKRLLERAERAGVLVVQSFEW